MVNPTREEELAVEDLLDGLNIPTRQDMNGLELSNRLYSEDGVSYLTATVLGHTTHNRPVARSATFILTEKTLVTVRYHEMTAFDLLKIRLTTARSRIQTPMALLIEMIETIIAHDADVLEDLGADLDEVSHKIFNHEDATSDLKSCIHTLGRKGDVIGKLKESLLSLDRLLAYMAVVLNSKTQNTEARLAVKTLSRDLSGLADYASFLSNKVNFLLDATLGMITNAQNGIIKIFSVAAVIFLPPTLIASIYGMNFVHMPELQWQYGYPMALGLMVFSAIAPYLFFKARKWL